MIGCGLSLLRLSGGSLHPPVGLVWVTYTEAGVTRAVTYTDPAGRVWRVAAEPAS